VDKTELKQRLRGYAVFASHLLQHHPKFHEHILETLGGSIGDAVL